MPWLVATASVHSLSVSEKRGAFKHWTVLLAISGFSLSLLGTFLVRSGILTSVHSFAVDPERGLFILIFLMIVVGGSLGLYARRASLMRSGNQFAPLSRESVLLINNILLVAATLVVFLGTMYPLLFASLGLGKISVGAPYFDFMFVIVMIPAVLVMAIGAFLRWKKDSVDRVTDVR
jgi:cytochrome c-type biogenesis protein CcmF